MAQSALIPADADAAVPFFLWAAGYYVSTNSGVILAVGGSIGAGIAANFIYDAITDDDCCSDDDDSSHSDESSDSDESSGSCSGNSWSGGGYDPSASYVH